MKQRWWIYGFVLLAAACRISSNKDEPQDDAHLGIKNATERKEANFAKVHEMKALVQDGDLILRTGTDFASEQVKGFNKKDQTYSHGGIAVRDSGDVYIYHVEPDFFHINNKVRKEKLDSFCSPVKNLGVAHARYNMDSAEIKAFLQYLDKQYRNKIPFDMGFQLRSNDSMYCSEMIRKGLMAATKGRITIETTKFDDPNKFRVIRQHLKWKDEDFAGRDFVPVDHLYLHPACTVIRRYVFE
jgi:hypothetical protein